MEERLFVIIFDKPCTNGCSDTEVRICRVATMEDATKIAKEHGNKYYKGWTFGIRTVVWDTDNTAYVYSNYN